MIRILITNAARGLVVRKSGKGGGKAKKLGTGRGLGRHMKLWDRLLKKTNLDINKQRSSGFEISHKREGLSEVESSGRNHQGVSDRMGKLKNQNRVRREGGLGLKPVTRF